MVDQKEGGGLNDDTCLVLVLSSTMVECVV